MELISNAAKLPRNIHVTRTKLKSSAKPQKATFNKPSEKHPHAIYFAHSWRLIFTSFLSVIVIFWWCRYELAVDGRNKQNARTIQLNGRDWDIERKSEKQVSEPLTSPREEWKVGGICIFIPFILNHLTLMAMSHECWSYKYHKLRAQNTETRSVFILSHTKTQPYSSSAYSFKVINKLLTLELEKKEQTFRCAMETLRKCLRFTWFSRTLSLCPFNFLVTSIPSCIIRYTNKHAYTKHTEEFPHP